MPLEPLAAGLIGDSQREVAGKCRQENTGLQARHPIEQVRLSIAMGPGSNARKRGWVVGSSPVLAFGGLVASPRAVPQAGTLRQQKTEVG